ncbi:MAG TPA: efflux RND transporter periplasmic adaptor subunit, partial [Flavobacteriales bacterium]|nr:efflux RND transporter periplasmic adaptor subunit [Flavobacteriales bacterium]
ATASIVSPIDGTVANIAVNVGSKVSGDATMFRVVNNSKLHVDLFLYEQDIAQVKVGQTVDLSLTNLPGRNYKAVIFAIGSAFESETKTIPVHAEITGDKEGLINGMGVTARIDVGNATTTAVLTEAIVNMEGKDFIFVKITGEADHDHAHTEADGHVHVEGEVHDHSTEHAHTEGETHVHDHGAGDAHTHAGEEAHAHEAPTTAPGSMSFQRIEVKRGATDGAYTAVTFLQAVPDHAEVVTGGAYYLLAMLNTSSGHQH